MSNFYRAIKALNDVDEALDHLADNEAYVSTLKTAGLLMPDLPELAQALTEETYFYGVQVWIGGRWIMMLTRDHGTGITHRGKWFEHKHEAEEYAKEWNHDTPTRIVRQRRSPVEVCE